jgi:hypothetical protein
MTECPPPLGLTLRMRDGTALSRRWVFRRALIDCVGKHHRPVCFRYSDRKPREPDPIQKFLLTDTGRCAAKSRQPAASFTLGLARLSLRGASTGP